MGKLIKILAIGSRRYIDRWLGIQMLQAPSLAHRELTPKDA